MGKYRTWAACGGLAAAITIAGIVADLALKTEPALTVVGVLIAVTYLVGTFAPNVTLFGRVARSRQTAARFALTFDDGPDPRFTPLISSYLADRGHRATFFVLGKAAAAHPDVLAKVAADGHEIASHGNDHRLLAFSSPRVIDEQLAVSETAILEATGHRPARLFRAPHGVRSPWLTATLRKHGYRLCGWQGSVFDTSSPGVDAIVRRVARNLEPGSVVLLHDGDGSGCAAPRDQTVEAIRGILAAAEERGLRSVPLSTLVA